LELTRRAEELEALGTDVLARGPALKSRELQVAFLQGWQLAHPDWSERIDLAKSVEDNAGALIEYAQRLKRARPKLEELMRTSGARLRAGQVSELQSAAGTAAKTAPDPLARDLSKLERSGVKYLRYVTSDGIAIIVGQSDRSNDELVRHYGSSRHLWLHVRDYPGSHVLLLTNGRDVPQRSLEEAAIIAGYYSKGRGETDLDVSYTPVKQLRRPRGGKPGQVLLVSEKVMRVNPARFEQLRDTLRVSASAS
jgi:predicted ribosome quality control (RQC) complex YloA/Tae2 family protein